MSVLVAIPVLGRPERASAVHASLTGSEGKLKLRLLFLCSPGDKAEIAACKKTGAETLVVPFEQAPGDYARKINHCVSLGDEEWIFTGADDLRFDKSWADLALGQGARRRAQVIGTNDLGNPAVKRGHHSTHTLVARSYAIEFGTIDQPGLIYHEGYHHNWCDVEMIETAKRRGVWAFCARAAVEHLHPHWGKAEKDATYELGLEKFKDDRRLYARRRRLWVAGRGYSRSL